jgi:hypothetical protein
VTRTLRPKPAGCVTGVGEAMVISPWCRFGRAAAVVLAPPPDRGVGTPDLRRRDHQAGQRSSRPARGGL